VLILTAIVVGVATLALGLALVVRIREAYGSIEEDEILALDHAEDGVSAPAGPKGGAANTRTAQRRTTMSDLGGG
jgi:multicomponent Na+:H+ antiporter subunit C